MMDMNNTSTAVHKDLDDAMTSLSAVERLAEILSAHADEAHDNDYLADAIQRAGLLVDEMERHLAAVVERYIREV